MYRIGIIGTENSHALAFARLMNLEDQGREARVVGVYGPDPDTPKRIQEEAGVDFIAQSPEDFLGRVDAMMITCRKGSLHYGYAKPFLQKGMPLFIDKPITSDWAQAQELVREARASGSLLIGGSGCKYAYDVLLLRNAADALRREGKLLSASVNFSADRDSVYDGFYFYAPHLTEIALAIFGDDIRSVRADESAGGVTVLARYDGFDVSLHYTKNSAVSTAVLYGQDRNLVRELDISLIYRHEVDHFLDMLRTGRMPYSYETLIKPVAVISSILASLETGKEAPVP